MRDINYGWMIRYIHLNGARRSSHWRHTSTCFRGLYYGSYKEPARAIVDAGCRYPSTDDGDGRSSATSLPWSQMGFWGATVITQPLRGNPGRRGPHRHVALGRLLCR